MYHLRIHIWISVYEAPFEISVSLVLRHVFESKRNKNWIEVLYFNCIRNKVKQAYALKYHIFMYRETINFTSLYQTPF